MIYYLCVISFFSFDDTTSAIYIKKNNYFMDADVGLSPLVRVERATTRETIGAIVGVVCEKHCVQDEDVEGNQ